MQNNDPLSELVRSVVPGGSAGSTTEVASSAGGDVLIRNTEQLAQLQSIFQQLQQVTSDNTRAVADNTIARGQSGAASIAGDVAQTAAGVITGGGLLSPVLSGLMKLFGGGSEAGAAPTVEKFALPSKISLDAGITGSLPGIAPVDYGQDSMPRMAPATPNVTVQVSAMDSQSFLDRSGDIANAVRRAMLESSSLNDVISEV